MKIEEGKYYKASGGHRVGPMRKVGSCFTADRTLFRWQENGLPLGCNEDLGFDLVAEWTDTLSPILERVVKEIRLGDYGKIKIPAYIHRAVGIGIGSGKNEYFEYFDASELRAASLLFNQLADFLERQS